MSSRLITIVVFLASAVLLYADAVEDEVNALLSEGLRASGWEQKEAQLKTQIVARLEGIMLDNRDYSRNYNRQRDARVVLLNIGNTVAITDTFRLYRGHYNDRRRMAEVIAKTAQPLLIPLLSEVPLPRFGGLSAGERGGMG